MHIIHRAALASIACYVLAGPVLADNFNIDADAEPLHLCRGLQKNVRFMHNAWDSGDKSTFGEIRTWLRQELSGKDDKRARMLKIYEDFAGRIEAGEYSEPKMGHAIGQVTIERNAGAACLTAFPTDYSRAPRTPQATPLPRD